ncbi:hypothetical protein QUA71_00895 [Microcoleus sp. MON1_C5]
MKEEGRRKREEGRRKREEGRSKKEEGRSKTFFFARTSSFYIYLEQFSIL